jgi:hypothetical protein
MSTISGDWFLGIVSNIGDMEFEAEMARTGEGRRISTSGDIGPADWV